MQTMHVFAKISLVIPAYLGVLFASDIEVILLNASSRTINLLAMECKMGQLMI